MTRFGSIGAIALLCWLYPFPAVAHDCGHHQRRHACWDCDVQSQRPQTNLQATANLQTLEGRISEVIYLPGAAAGSGMVEIQLQTAGQTRLVRLAPTGFLKQAGLRLLEGSTVTVKGFPVAGMEGDIVVATEVQSDGKHLSLRDSRGRPAW